MKIVLFDFVFERGRPGITGLSDVVWNWARQLTALGEEVHIVAPYAASARPPEGAIVHRFPVPPIGYRNILGHLLIVLRGWQEIRKLDNIDIIHAPEYLSTGILAPLARDTPVVLTVPGNIYERIAHGNPFDWSTTQVLKVAAGLSARWCARIIAISEEMQRWWEKTGTPPSRLALIPLGVDTQRFRPIAHARETLGFPAEKQIVLYVGRLSREKGVHHLLEAMKQVGQKFPAAELHLVGDGPMKSDLVRMARDLKIEQSVAFDGWVDQRDLPRYYSAADVTVLPSSSEGMPRTMIESMACGSLFLGTNITGIVDHVRDGETGFLVAPGNSDQLAQKLDGILGDGETRQRVARRGCTYVRQELDWKTIVRRTRDEVYQPLVVRR